MMPRQSRAVDRRRFLRTAAAGIVALSVADLGHPVAGQGTASKSSRRVSSDRADQTEPTRRYPLFRAEGTHRQLGQQHGEHHFLCAPYACQEDFDESLPDSFTRLDRMNAMIRGRLGRIAVDDVRLFLSDHANHPTSICRHARTRKLAEGFVRAGQTVAAIIAEPSRRRLQVACGNPCQAEFVTYAMD